MKILLKIKKKNMKEPHQIHDKITLYIWEETPIIKGKKTK